MALADGSLRVELREVRTSASNGSSWNRSSGERPLIAPELFAATELTPVGPPLAVEAPVELTIRSPGARPPVEWLPLSTSAVDDDQVQFLVVAYEDGSYRFLLPVNGAVTTDDRVWYEMPTPSAPLQRGIAGAAVRFVVQHVVGQAGRVLASRAGGTLVGWWEREHRPERVRWFRPGDYQTANVQALEPSEVGSGRTLLLIHGTNSLAHAKSGFGGMPPDLVAGLSDAYGGRVLAFDHPTLSCDPVDNAAWLCRWLEACGDIELDVLAHSRGGLVARLLAEQTGLGPVCPSNARVRSVTFAATPHQGTPLANPEHLGGLFDRLISLVPFSLMGTVGELAEGTLTAVRQLASGVLDDLHGLTAMAPKSELLQRLALSTIAPDVTYRALAADFEPEPGSGLWNAMKDRGVDIVFEGLPNDGIVPTLSALQVGRQPGDGFHDAIVFDERDRVRHSSLVSHPAAAAVLQAWLRPAPAPVPVSVRDRLHTPAEIQSLAAMGPEWGLATLKDLACFAPPSWQGPLNDVVSRVGAAVWPSSARDSSSGRPITVVVPGIMGSSLSVSGEPVWMSPWRLVAGAFHKLRNDGTDRHVVADEVLCYAYRALTEKLAEAGHTVVGLPYDWRLDLEPAADRLARLLTALLDEATTAGRPVHVVAHSMGGLVVRWSRLRHPDVWERVAKNASGSRIVLLGTPNLGSYAAVLALTGEYPPIRLISWLDVHSTAAEILEQIWDFPGLVQLLPAPSLLGADLTERLYVPSSWPVRSKLADHNLQLALDQHHELAAATGAGIHLVLGDGVETPSSVRFEDHQLRVLLRSEGDGTVAVNCGRLEGVVSTLYADQVGHADLVKDPRSLQCVVDLLTRGSTKVFPSERASGGQRGGPVLGQDWLSPADAADRLDNLATGEIRGGSLDVGPVDRTSAADAATRGLAVFLPQPSGRGRVATLDVAVKHASLDCAQYPLLFGHATHTPIAGAEGRVDRLLEGRLSELHALGLLPDRPDESRWVPSVKRYQRIRGAIVVALDSRTPLTSSALTDLVTAALVDYADRRLEVESDVVGESTVFGVSAVPLGTGPVHNLDVERSVVAIVRGVIGANTILTKVGRRPFTHLEIIEQYAAKAERAHWALNRLALDLGALGESWLIDLDPKVEPGDGARPGTPSPRYDEGRWERLFVHANDPEDPDRDAAATADQTMWVTYQFARDQAAVDQRPRRIDRQVIRQRVRMAVQERSSTREQGVALYEDLFPAQLKDELSLSDNLVLIVDKATADIPWEMLVDRLESSRPLSASRGLLRQFVEPDVRPRAARQHTKTALVIGDPPTQFTRLPGARREAERVFEILRNAGLADEAPQVFDNSDASTSAGLVRGRLYSGDYQIIHIAAHGLYNLGTGANGDIVGGVAIGANSYLTADDFANLRVPPDLVFLNCCHLARVDALVEPAAGLPKLFSDDQGAAAASIARALIRLGVKAVVVAGWAVNDRVAHDFATRFYEEMATHGRDFGAAVKRAREMAFRDPFRNDNTWAAYQCYGDPSFRLTSGKAQDAPGDERLSMSDVAERRLRELLNDIHERDDREDDELIDRIERLDQAVERQWPDRGDLLALRAEAWGDVGRFDQATTLYQRALRTDGSVRLKALEQYVNLLSRAANTRKRQDANDPSIDDLMNTAAGQIEVLQRLPENAERNAMIAGYHKRRAVLHETERSAEITSAASWYRKAIEGQAVPPAYQLCHYLQLLAIEAMRNDAPLDGSDTIETWIGIMLDTTTRDPGRGSYFDRVAIADSLLTMCLLATAGLNLSQRIASRPQADPRLQSFGADPMDKRLLQVASSYTEARRARAVNRDWRSTVDDILDLSVLCPNRALSDGLVELYHQLGDAPPRSSDRLVNGP